MTDFEYQRMRERASSKDIVSVAERLGMTLHRYGCHYKALCPFHDDHHPSLIISPKRNTFKCFSCGEGGDAIQLVEKTTGKGFLEACEWILGEAILPRQHVADSSETAKDTDYGPDINVLHNLVSAREYSRCLAPWAIDFFRQRRLDLNLADRYAIVSIDRRMATHSHRISRPDGSSYLPSFPAPSLLFPYRDKNDLFVNLQARLCNPRPGQQRFHFPIGSRTSLWNPYDIVQLPDGSDFWICEGVSDALALLTSGRTPLALSSATGLDTETRTFIAQQAQRLHPHIYSDNDNAGQALYNKLLCICPTIRRHPLPDGIKDFGQAWAQGMIQSLNTTFK